MIHISVRHDPDSATVPHTSGPRVTAPNRPTSTIATDHGRRLTPNRVINGGSAEIIIRPVGAPWTTRPARKAGSAGATAVSAEPATKVATYPTKSGRCANR